MRKALLNKCLGSLALALLLNLSTVSVTQATSLVIEDYRLGERLECVDTLDQSFSLTFIHSVSLTPVIDKYKLIKEKKGGYKIMQTEERFIAHGQGLPSMENEPNAIAFERRNGYFVIKLERPIGKLIVRTDSRFKNRLHSGEKVVNLNQWPANTGLFIYPVNRCQ